MTESGTHRFQLYGRERSSCHELVENQSLGNLVPHYPKSVFATCSVCMISNDSSLFKRNGSGMLLIENLKREENTFRIKALGVEEVSASRKLGCSRVANGVAEPK